MLEYQTGHTDMSATQELAECTKEPPVGMKVHLVDEASIYKWEVLIDGPPESPYAVGPISYPLIVSHVPADYR